MRPRADGIEKTAPLKLSESEAPEGFEIYTAAEQAVNVMNGLYGRSGRDECLVHLRYYALCPERLVMG